MRAEDLRELSDTELDEKLEEFKTELFNLRFELATGQLDNYKRLRSTKRSIARVMTVQNQRQAKTATSAVAKETS